MGKGVARHAFRSRSGVLRRSRVRRLQRVLALPDVLRACERRPVHPLRGARRGRASGFRAAALGGRRAPDEHRRARGIRGSAGGVSEHRRLRTEVKHRRRRIDGGGRPRLDGGRTSGVQAACKLRDRRSRHVEIGAGRSSHARCEIHRFDRDSVHSADRRRQGDFVVASGSGRRSGGFSGRSASRPADHRGPRREDPGSLAARDRDGSERATFDACLGARPDRLPHAASAVRQTFLRARDEFFRRSAFRAECRGLRRPLRPDR